MILAADDEGDDNDYQCYLNFFNYNSKDSARAKVENKSSSVGRYWIICVPALKRSLQCILQIHYIVQSQDPPPNFCNGHGTASLAYQSCDPGTGVGCDEYACKETLSFCHVGCILMYFRFTVMKLLQAPIFSRVTCITTEALRLRKLKRVYLVALIPPACGNALVRKEQTMVEPMYDLAMCCNSSLHKAYSALLSATNALRHA